MAKRSPYRLSTHFVSHLFLRVTSNGGWKKITYRNNPKPTENWLGHIIRGDSLLRTIIEGRMEGKKKRGRLRMMILDLMMKEDYGKLKERAGHRGEWRHRTYEGREPRRRRSMYAKGFQTITRKNLSVVQDTWQWMVIEINDSVSMSVIDRHLFAISCLVVFWKSIWPERLVCSWCQCPGNRRCWCRDTQEPDCPVYWFRSGPLGSGRDSSTSACAPGQKKSAENTAWPLLKNFISQMKNFTELP